MISTVSPMSLAGDTATVTVSGSGFLPASVVKLNGTILSTTFNSSAKLIANGSLRAATAQAFPYGDPTYRDDV